MIKLPKLEPGDIVCRKRPKYDKRWYMFWKYLIQRLICFFTTEWWRGEEVSVVSHAEMVWADKDNGSFFVIDQEPPSVQLKSRSLNAKCVIFRLRKKLPDFIPRFEVYCAENWRKKYHFARFILFMLWFVFLKWNFMGRAFSRWLAGTQESVCSVFVARFYENVIGTPCSKVSAELTAPDDIYDYCKTHLELFGTIWGELA